MWHNHISWDNIKTWFTKETKVRIAFISLAIRVKLHFPPAMWFYLFYSKHLLACCHSIDHILHTVQWQATKQNFSQKSRTSKSLYELSRKRQAWNTQSCRQERVNQAYSETCGLCFWCVAWVCVCTCLTRPNIHLYQKRDSQSSCIHLFLVRFLWKLVSLNLFMSFSQFGKENLYWLQFVHHKSLSLANMLTFVTIQYLCFPLFICQTPKTGQSGRTMDEDPTQKYQQMDDDTQDVEIPKILCKEHTCFNLPRNMTALTCNKLVNLFHS